MEIAADMLRGHTDTIILRRLLNGDTYGYEINKTVRTLTQGGYELKEATLYTAFRRLETEGLITSYWGEASTGARRRYYAITDAGRTQYQQRIQEWSQTKETIDQLIL